MLNYETFSIKNAESLKTPSVYFYLKSQGFSERYINKLRKIDQGIKINTQTADLNSRIKNDDVLEISNDTLTKSEFPKVRYDNLDILFEDEDFLIVNKPHNVACMPSRSHYADNLGWQVCSYMQTKTNNFVLRVINRLDKETAGIVIIAKNLFAYQNVGKIHKEYFAICFGNLSQNKTTIDLPILTKTENGINVMKREVSEKGKKALTHISLIKNYDNYCLVKAVLETGRTHQIRVHCSHIGHSLVGDTLYTDEKSTIFKTFKKTIPDHTMLILKNVVFKHFRTNKEIKIEIPFPKEWEDFIK